MINNNDFSIGIIDSGIGGLCLAKELIKQKGNVNFIYYADNLFMPYGNKKRKTIARRVERIIKTLQEDYKVSIVIIACNTASSSIDINKFKNVLCLEYDKNNTYLATKLTKCNLPNINVIEDQTLAKQIEKHITNKEKLNKIIKLHCAKFKLNTLASFVLGCTHYELVKECFQTCCPNTQILGNCQSIIDKINYTPNKETNFKVILSKESKSYTEKIVHILKN